MKLIVLLTLLVSCYIVEPVDVTFGQRVRIVDGFYAGCQGTAVDLRSNGHTVIVKVTDCQGEPKDFEVELRKGQYVKI